MRSVSQQSLDIRSIFAKDWGIKSDKFLSTAYLRGPAKAWHLSSEQSFFRITIMERASLYLAKALLAQQNLAYDQDLLSEYGHEAKMAKTNMVEEVESALAAEKENLSQPKTHRPFFLFRESPLITEGISYKSARHGSCAERAKRRHSKELQELQVLQSLQRVENGRFANLQRNSYEEASEEGTMHRYEAFVRILHQDLLPLDAATKFALRLVSRELRQVVTGQIIEIRATLTSKISYVTRFINLQHLDLRGCLSTNVTDAALAELMPLRKTLRSLDICSCLEVSDSGLASLVRNLPGLTSVSIKWCEQITDEGVTALASLTGLTSLNLHGCDKVTDKSLAALQARTRLSSLNLYECSQVTDEGIAMLATLSNLQHLSLGWCEQITDKGLTSLASLTALMSIDICGCDLITEKGVNALKLLKALRPIDCTWCW
ncbi:hypothetical protein CYMTET_2707 [Cymbomonas tetramitiformis]|uniref:F-box/LRR-repeat protein 15-like leucin rich repeat domain-containing protein n=1 Tax=Cymbomonas tetramitiformis TaxID=36881 RepID=A0AAE0H4U0_9CHLO|nr:hypothetical protein CYMTET_2707 [Cymbomonas tetramitiformis]